MEALQVTGQLPIEPIIPPANGRFCAHGNGAASTTRTWGRPFALPPAVLYQLSFNVTTRAWCSNPNAGPTCPIFDLPVADPGIPMCAPSNLEIGNE